MNNNRLLATGLTGTVIAALCCFTPILVIVLGIFGFSALIAYLDIVLLPALAICLAITVYAVWRKSTREAS